jgi:hypothetical protein
LGALIGDPGAGRRLKMEKGQGGSSWWELAYVLVMFLLAWAIVSIGYGVLPVGVGS